MLMKASPRHQKAPNRGPFIWGSGRPDLVAESRHDEATDEGDREVDKARKSDENEKWIAAHVSSPLARMFSENLTNDKR